MSNKHSLVLHTILVILTLLTLLPFFFVVNNSFRTNSELYHTFFGLPQNLLNAVRAIHADLTGKDIIFHAENDAGEPVQAPPKPAINLYLRTMTKGYRYAWQVISPYLVNSFVVCLSTAVGVVLLASLSAYVISRYRFPGAKLIFYYIIGTMMFPGILTLVPSFLLVKRLGLLDTYWVMILPYVASGQVFALFLFKGFFDGLPEELFESARLDGAGHLQCYRHIVIPLSKPIFSLVFIINIMGTWNNFLWPFITNTEGKYHVIASGLYVLATSPHAANYSTLFAAYMISSIPLLLLFVFSTRTFIQGVTSGAFKA
ncbi:MAG TPA: carbohydrate ABC transporter permease [Candidatus Hydrogenedentes bacterium]|nr:carbohydrate ABC transporter permease [Candidatus Hydrogenedentota bacterium]HOL78050.1 carbohydrate ABC transporter permease [Candidatus Hydrogenedentota bacterium]HPO84590.1 carbohydrate ABC transporter permease [Candidatus Hydrogenedentota bacterium]